MSEREAKSKSVFGSFAGLGGKGSEDSTTQAGGGLGEQVRKRLEGAAERVQEVRATVRDKLKEAEPRYREVEKSVVSVSNVLAKEVSDKADEVMTEIGKRLTSIGQRASSEQRGRENGEKTEATTKGESA